MTSSSHPTAREDIIGTLHVACAGRFGSGLQTSARESPLAAGKTLVWPWIVCVCFFFFFRALGDEK